MPEYKHPDLVAITNGEVMDTMGYSEYIKYYKEIPEYDDEFKAFFTLAFFTGARPEELRRLQGKHVEKEGRELLVRIPGGVKGSRERVLLFPLNEESIRRVADFADGLFPRHYVFPMMYRFRNISSAWEYRCKKYSLRRKDAPIPEYFFRHNLVALIGRLGRTFEEVFLLPFYVQGKTPPLFKGTSMIHYFHNTQIMAEHYKKMVRNIIKKT